MLIKKLKSKISYATVMQKDLYYVGSITIDSAIMVEALIEEGEQVQIVNLNNGERLETYVIAGEPGSGVFGLNGPAARKCELGDQIFIISYAFTEMGATNWQPKLIDMQTKKTI